jgi:hypothetical protein
MSPELALKYFFDIFFYNFELIITIAIVLLIVPLPSAMVSTLFGVQRSFYTILWADGTSSPFGWYRRL